jgi:hypothetical protein
LAIVVAKLVETVADDALELAAKVPVWSNGVVVATFRHSVIWAMLAFGTTKAALVIPPGLSA